MIRASSSGLLDDFLSPFSFAGVSLALLLLDAGLAEVFFFFLEDGAAFSTSESPLPEVSSPSAESSSDDFLVNFFLSFLLEGVSSGLPFFEAGLTKDFFFFEGGESFSLSEFPLFTSTSSSVESSLADFLVDFFLVFFREGVLSVSPLLDFLESLSASESSLPAVSSPSVECSSADFLVNSILVAFLDGVSLFLGAGLTEVFFLCLVGRESTVSSSSVESSSADSLADFFWSFFFGGVFFLSPFREPGLVEVFFFFFEEKESYSASDAPLFTASSSSVESSSAGFLIDFFSLVFLEGVFLVSPLFLAGVPLVPVFFDAGLAKDPFLVPEVGTATSVSDSSLASMSSSLVEFFLITFLVAFFWPSFLEAVSLVRLLLVPLPTEGCRTPESLSLVSSTCSDSSSVSPLSCSVILCFLLFFGGGPLPAFLLGLLGIEPLSVKFSLFCSMVSESSLFNLVWASFCLVDGRFMELFWSFFNGISSIESDSSLPLESLHGLELETRSAVLSVASSSVS